MGKEYKEKIRLALQRYSVTVPKSRESENTGNGGSTSGNQGGNDNPGGGDDDPEN